MVTYLSYRQENQDTSLVWGCLGYFEPSWVSPQSSYRGALQKLRAWHACWICLPPAQLSVRNIYRLPTYVWAILSCLGLQVFQIPGICHALWRGFFPVLQPILKIPSGHVLVYPSFRAGKLLRSMSVCPPWKQHPKCQVGEQDQRVLVPLEMSSLKELGISTCL